MILGATLTLFIVLDDGLAFAIGEDSISQRKETHEPSLIELQEVKVVSAFERSFFLINFPIFLNQESKLFTPPIRTDWQAFNGIEGLAEEEAFSTRTMGWDPEAD